MISSDMFSIPMGVFGDAHDQELVIPEYANPNPKPNPKKRRNLPGTPDPDAEVIALSPKSLMATNRFVCEICNKGFQREQNLQLHRRGHNLPWKLRQRSNKEIVRKKVYICPEKTCIHHDPSRALGDLTGIKKHFSRKHGEKKWKCDKCSKKYAVKSDWKAHSKTCGTREYKCDCGTIFSRKDSFITHRAFCDALADETARLTSNINMNFTNDPINSNLNTNTPSNFHHIITSPTPMPNFSGTFRPNLNAIEMLQMTMPMMNFSNLNNLNNQSETKPGTLSLSTIGGERNSNSPMSATALLQKAALMGSTTSNPNPNPGFLPDLTGFNPDPLMSFSSGLEQIMMQNTAVSRNMNRVESGLTRDFLGAGFPWA